MSATSARAGAQCLPSQLGTNRRRSTCCKSERDKTSRRHPLLPSLGAARRPPTANGKGAAHFIPRIPSIPNEECRKKIRLGCARSRAAEPNERSGFSSRFGCVGVCAVDSVVWEARCYKVPIKQQQCTVFLATTRRSWCWVAECRGRSCIYVSAVVYRALKSVVCAHDDISLGRGIKIVLDDFLSVAIRHVRSGCT